MQIIFRKNEKSEISVTEKVAGKEFDFSYVDMIKTLIASEKMEPPEISGNFSDEEKISINSMVTHINAAIEK